MNGTERWFHGAMVAIYQAGKRDVGSDAYGCRPWRQIWSG